jgi:hypothetical protein
MRPRLSARYPERINSIAEQGEGERFGTYFKRPSDALGPPFRGLRCRHALRDDPDFSSNKVNIGYV